MKLIKELFLPSQFTLLTAPVAAGKTKLIMEFYEEESMKMIFVSPLRALANEVYAKLKSSGKNVFLTGGGESRVDESLVNFLQCRKGVLVATMELLNEDFLEAVASQQENVFFVLDEFHLFYHWGEAFRPVLHDRFLAILNTELPVIGVTATMGEFHFEALQKDLSFHCEQWFHIDYGNHILHRSPARIHYFLPMNFALFHRSMWREIKNKNPRDVYLIFCPFRSAVDEYVERCRRSGLKSIGCVGGEVEQFLKELEGHNHQVDCIFSTTTLSHGVNLPEIKKVFICYEVKDFEFWLQMVGRGGRQGSDYEVFTMDSFLADKKDLLKSRLINYVADWISF